MTETSTSTTTRRGMLAGLGGAGLGLAGATLLGGIAGAGRRCRRRHAVLHARERADRRPVLRRPRAGSGATSPRARPGIRLDLRIKIVDSETCKPLKNAAVDIWHCDALGVYSDIASEGTSGKTYLRGVQVTDSSGLAVFRTIYPGLVRGARAAHPPEGPHGRPGERLEVRRRQGAAIRASCSSANPSPTRWPGCRHTETPRRGPYAHEQRTTSTPRRAGRSCTSPAAPPGSFKTRA